MEAPRFAGHSKFHKKPVTGLAYHPVISEQFASCSEDHTACIWLKEKQSQKVRDFKNHTDNVTGIAYNADGNFLATCSKDKTVVLLKLEPFAKSRLIKVQHDSPLNCLTFTIDGNMLITGAEDNTLKVSDVATRKSVATFQGHTNAINSVKMSSKNFIVSSSDDCTIKIWDVNSGKCIDTFKMNSVPGKIAVHKNGTSIVTAQDSGSVRLYDYKAKCLQQYYKLFDKTIDVDFHPQKNLLLTTGLNFDFIMIDTKLGKPLIDITSDNLVYCCKFNPDGHSFLLGTENKISKWQL